MSLILQELVKEACRLVHSPGRARQTASAYEMRRQHPLRNVFAGMRDRCRNPNNPNFKSYGGRGIAICDRWLEPGNGFKNFCADMGERPPGLTLDRINSDGPYSPDNCRWATSNQQYRNRRSNVWVTHDGETKIKADWARDTGGHRGLVNLRMRDGATLEEAISTPAMARTESLKLAVAKHAANKRSETHCKRGHEFTESNTVWNTSSGRKPARSCRICRRAWDKYIYEKKARPLDEIVKEYENVL